MDLHPPPVDVQRTMASDDAIGLAELTCSKLVLFIMAWFGIFGGLPETPPSMPRSFFT